MCMMRSTELGGRRSVRLAVSSLVSMAVVLWAAHGQSEPLRWRWSHPQPHGNNVIDMAWSMTGGYWLQAAEQGTLYTSRDGFSWIPQESGTRLALRGVAFLGERAVVTGEAGTVLYADAPEAFRVGQLDTGPTTDWLEGVAASPALAVAVGDNGAIYTSTNGAAWTRVESGVDDWLRGVAYGVGLFVAVGEQGTILSSSDGTVWTRRNSQTSAHLNRVALTPNGFVAVGDGGTVISSVTGNTWSSLLTGATGDLFTVGSTALDILVAGDVEVRVRTGTVWSDELGGLDGPLPATYLASVGDTSSLFIAGQAGMMAEGFRLGAGPYQWFLRSSPLRPLLFDGTWVSNLFVAVGDRSTVMTSVDGVDWSYEFPPVALTNAALLGVGGNTNLLVAAGSGGSLMTSSYGITNVISTNDLGLVVTQAVNTLGVVWRAVQPAPTTEDLQGVCHWNDRYFVTGNAGLVLSSADGDAWVSHHAPTPQFLSGITSFPGGMVASGTRGAVVYTPDGESWTALGPFSTNWIYRVRWVNDQLMGVGQNGTILASSNGVDWEFRNSGTTVWLTDVSWVAGRYYAVGLSGKVLVSSDGHTWLDEGTLTRKTLYAAFTDHERLIVAGDEGVILRTPVLSGTTPVEFLGYSREPAPDGETWENLFLMSGRTDQRFTLDHAPAVEGQEWVSGPPLEFRDSTGTLLYWESVPVGETPALEFHRTKSLP
jgi:hypothetical protein